jgi:glycosyltransferase involved in cell wall biosynthesis
MRRRTGFLIGTRPGLNAAIARLQLPGTIDVGQEHMHFGHHVKPLRKLIRRTYPRLDAVAVLTEGDRREYAAALKDDVRLVAIANAAREMGGPPVDLAARTVLAAGRLGNQKGFDLLIAAFARIAGDHPDWKLRIHGKGGARARLKAQIRESGLTKQVSIEGPAAELGNEMAQASIYALSSRFEGFPLILIEAMSKGMAVCAFDCPTGPGEIIDDHRNGILVPAEDVAALAAGLSELMADEDLRRRCAAAAAETASGYTMDAIGRRWDTLLRELWDERAAASASS